MSDQPQELLEREGAGGLPDFLGIEVVGVQPGRATARMEVRPHLLSTFGRLHGGVTAALVDHALGASVLRLIPAGHWPATLEFKLNYLASIEGGMVEASAEVLTATRRTAVVRIDVSNDGRLVAAGQGTVMIVEPRQDNGGGQ